MRLGEKRLNKLKATVVPEELSERLKLQIIWTVDNRHV